MVARHAERKFLGVIFLHDNPQDVEEMRRANREKVEKLYDKQELHQTFKSMYEEMAGNRKGGDE